MEKYPSKTIEEAVNQISKLPGIGRKTALRLALHLLTDSQESVSEIAQSLLKLKSDTKYCKRCHNFSDDDICLICSSSSRDTSIICVVTDTRDVMAIENTHQFRGLYHILGGLISPIQGIGPSELNIETLFERINPEVKEVILALSPTMEGDTTAFYLNRRLKELPIIISSIARGVPVGGELEYTDEITLGRSIAQRIKQV